jgi:SHS2 domain-containing protein
MDRQPWEEIDHTADWALRVWGEDLPDLLENAACGMISLLGEQSGPSAGSSQTWDFSLAALDGETLLVDWLTELIFLMEEEGVRFEHFNVLSVDDGLSVRAQAAGTTGAVFDKHIKAATYHNLQIQQTENGLETVIVFDV